jgi:hypothetical protein
MKKLLLTGIAALLLATSAAAATDADICYTVTMTNSQGAGAVGAILLDKCTGKTWILRGSQNGQPPVWVPLGFERGSN